MFYVLDLLALATLAVAQPHRFAPHDNSDALIEPRQGSTCSTDGALICSSDGSKFAICSWGHAAFQAVAAGTTCVCTGGDNNLCTIAAADSAASNPSPPGPPAPPAPKHSSPAHTHSHSSQVHKPSLKPHKPSSPAPKPSKPAPKPSPPPHKPSSAPPTYSNSTAPPPSSGPWTYKTYLGDGSPSEGWPTSNQWVSFDALWTSNLASRISTSCSAFSEPNNSAQESEEIRTAILAEAKTCGVDPRLALAQMIQESGGCVRVPTTNYGVVNPGLFQSHNGAGTCVGANPCPDSEIKLMVADGISGTADGDGLKGVIAQATQEGYQGVAADYAGLRIYNSGSIAASGKLEDGIATHCYVSDIANRLMGWTTGTTGWTLDA